MRSLRTLLLLQLLLLLGVARAAQREAAQPPSVAGPASNPDDLSRQAFVEEAVRSEVRLEDDGTSTRYSYARIRIQSEAAVRLFGLIRVGYTQRSQRVKIDFVRVIKTGGNVVTADASAVQEFPADVQRIAPQYSDLRDMHITVPSLRPGDTLEYAVTITTFAPDVPGQFWLEYNFDRTNPVLKEELQVDVPTDRALKLESAPDVQPKIEDRNARRIYSWTHSNAIPVDRLNQPFDSEWHAPDVQLTSFQNWNQVAAWYGALQEPMAAVTPAIREKAMELTRGLTSESDKLLALYDYVSTSIRYVSLSFGIGRYQPHSADEVLRNQYGDCKDKHTLLQALLAAVGIHADPVLISVNRKLDPDLPSPVQFDHLITAVSAGGDRTFLDTTTEVGPLGYLVPPIRGKQALLIAGGRATLVTTPADPPQPSREEANFDGAISDNGTLTADVSVVASGDLEIVWRGLLRSISVAQRADMLNTILRDSSLDGDVSTVVATDPSDLRHPFRLTFHLVKRNYIKWPAESSQFDLPMLKLGLRPAASPNQRKDPIHPTKAITVRKLRLKVPEGSDVVLPPSLTKTEDWAGYKATYGFADGVITASREYSEKGVELPRSRYEDYNALYEVAAKNASEEATLATVPILARRSAGPAEGSPNQLYDEAQRAIQFGQSFRAEDLLQELVRKAPDREDAWRDLGSIYFQRALTEPQYGEKAIAAYRKALAIKKDDMAAAGSLAAILLVRGDYGEAAELLEHLSKLAPDDPALDIPLGTALLHDGQAGAAVEPLRRAVEGGSRDISARTLLARAYLRSGHRDDGLRTLEPLMSESASPGALAAAAEALADSDAELDRAAELSRRALSRAYVVLGSNDVEKSESAGTQRTWDLVRLWEIAGWVLFKQGKGLDALRYLEAAWAWAPFPVNGDHLAQAYLALGQKQDALRVWVQALRTRSLVTVPGMKQRFIAAAGGAANAEALLSRASSAAQEQPAIEVANTSHLQGSAMVDVLFGANGKIAALHMVNGDEKLAALAPALKEARSPISFPDPDPIYVLRSGELSCSRYRANCMLVLVPPPRISVEVSLF